MLGRVFRGEVLTAFAPDTNLCCPVHRALLSPLPRTPQLMTFCFFICACVISSNANAGFNVVLTAVMYVVYVALLAAVFNRKRAVSMFVLSEAPTLPAAVSPSSSPHQSLEDGSRRYQLQGIKRSQEKVKDVVKYDGRGTIGDRVGRPLILRMEGQG